MGIEDGDIKITPKMTVVAKYHLDSFKKGFMHFLRSLVDLPIILAR